MGTTTKQRRELQNKEYCKKYLQPDWDGCAAREYFCTNSRPDPEMRYYGKPSGEPFDKLRQNAIAENDIHCLLANYADYKDRLIERLEAIIANEVIPPQNSKLPEEYKNTYLSRANEILRKIKNEAFDFQRPIILKKHP
jgi:hypothetical protein